MPQWGLAGLDFAQGISDRGDLRQGLLSNVLEELETRRQSWGNPAGSKCWKQLEPLGRGVQRGEKGFRAKKQQVNNWYTELSQDPDTRFLDGETEAQRAGTGFAQSINDVCVVLPPHLPAEFAPTPPTSPKRSH